MYSELIYTRCRQGIDIQKDGKTLPDDGFKIYSCSSGILDENNTCVDIPFLFDAIQRKQTYNDPAFMDDAYIFITPDFGEKLMVDFHPIHFDRTAQGDYAHRRGNFINQVFVGGFEDIYPYELFGDKGTWDAKARGEAYYYENDPQPLAEREEIKGTAGSIAWDDISEFIADGRADVLKKAIAFMIEQYELPPEKRKYLIVRDESAAKIELWIAAIESAFSPRMASGLSFATRLDNFVLANRYAVDHNGCFQPQMNLQDPKQIQRLRAMIVGVDERDRVNNVALRTVANAPYVILDGKEKRITHDCDISSSYYEQVIAYNEKHKRFCREFLQMLDIRHPVADIIKLHEVFFALDGVTDQSACKQVALSIRDIEKYEIVSCPYLSRLYNSLKENLGHFLRENSLHAFKILNWLKKAGLILGDEQAANNFEVIVSQTFADDMYKDPASREVTEFWEDLKESSFFDITAFLLTEPEMQETYRDYLIQFGMEQWIAFFHIFFPCAKRANAFRADGTRELFCMALTKGYQENDKEASAKLCEMIFKMDERISENLLVDMIEDADREYAVFLLGLLLHVDKKITCSDDTAVASAVSFAQRGCSYLCADVLGDRVKQFSDRSEWTRFFDTISNSEELRGVDLSSAYAVIDSKLSLLEKNDASLAIELQKVWDKKTPYTISAHICALLLLDRPAENLSLNKMYPLYQRQGFPSIDNEIYINSIVDKLLSCDLVEDEWRTVTEIFASSEAYMAPLIREIIKVASAENHAMWNALIDTMKEEENFPLMKILVEECIAQKKSEKQLTQLSELLESRASYSYFSKVIDEVKGKPDKARKHSAGSLLGIRFDGKNKK